MYSANFRAAGETSCLKGVQTGSMPALRPASVLLIQVSFCGFAAPVTEPVAVGYGAPSAEGRGQNESSGVSSGGGMLPWRDGVFRPAGHGGARCPREAGRADQRAGVRLHGPASEPHG